MVSIYLVCSSTAMSDLDSCAVMALKIFAINPKLDPMTLHDFVVVVVVARSCVFACEFSN